MIKGNLAAWKEINMTEKSNPVSIHALTDANIQLCDVGEILTAEQRALEHSEPD